MNEVDADECWLLLRERARRHAPRVAKKYNTGKASGEKSNRPSAIKFDRRSAQMVRVLHSSNVVAMVLVFVAGVVVAAADPSKYFLHGSGSKKATFYVKLLLNKVEFLCSRQKSPLILHATKK